MPRANINANGEVEYVFPYETGVITQLGVKNNVNPDYFTAKYHVMMFVGQAPAAIVKPGGEEAMLEAFRPKNPDFNWQLAIDPCSAPKDNIVYFWTEATLGWEPGNYPHVYIGLFRRRDESYMAADWGAPICISDYPACPNAIPAQDCPCPQVVGQCAGESASQLVFSLDVGLLPVPAVGSAISFKLANGGVASGTVAGISTDGVRIRVDFGVGVTPSDIPGWYKEILCNTSGACKAMVAVHSDCTPGDNQADLQLCSGLVALTAGDLLKVTFCDGFSTNAAFVSANLATFTYTVGGVGAEDIEQLKCLHGSIASVCVQPTVANGCPDCDCEFDTCSGGTVVLPHASCE